MLREGARLVRASAVAVVLGAAAVSAAQEADGNGSVVRVAYEGPLECSSAADFIRRTSPRLPGIALEPAQDDAAVIRVRMTVRGSEVEASLLVLLETGGSLSRSIVAASCDEAAEAIAFVASVALDPGAQSPVRVKKSPAPAAAPSDRATGPRAATGGLLGVGASLDVGPGPVPLPGALVFLSWGVEAAGPWAPSGRVELGFQRQGGYPVGEASADFELLRGALDLCPSSVRIRPVSLRLCATLDAGMFTAAGSNIELPQQASRLWLSAGLGARLSVPLGRRFELGVRGAGLAPLVRDSFSFDGAVFHRVPPVVGRVGLDFGLRFR